MSESDIMLCLAPESWDFRFLLQSFASLLLFGFEFSEFQVLEYSLRGQNINAVKVHKAEAGGRTSAHGDILDVSSGVSVSFEVGLTIRVVVVKLGVEVEEDSFIESHLLFFLLSREFVTARDYLLETFRLGVILVE